MRKLLHPDETKSPDLKWCPNCGCKADIVTWESQLGTRYRCRYEFCGLTGRFGDGLPEPTRWQPGFEEDKESV